MWEDKRTVLLCTLCGNVVDYDEPVYNVDKNNERREGYIWHKRCAERAILEEAMKEFEADPMVQTISALKDVMPQEQLDKILWKNYFKGDKS